MFFFAVRCIFFLIRCCVVFSVSFTLYGLLVLDIERSSEECRVRRTIKKENNRTTHTRDTNNNKKIIQKLCITVNTWNKRGCSMFTLRFFLVFLVLFILHMCFYLHFERKISLETVNWIFFVVFSPFHEKIFPLQNSWWFFGYFTNWAMDKRTLYSSTGEKFPVSISRLH